MKGQGVAWHSRAAAVLGPAAGSGKLGSQGFAKIIGRASRLARIYHGAMRESGSHP